MRSSVILVSFVVWVLLDLSHLQQQTGNTTLVWHVHSFFSLR
jgi:hypothetical protein